MQIRNLRRQTRYEQEKEYATTFVVSGMVAILEQWIKGTSEPILNAQELSQLVCRITGVNEF